MGVSRTGTTVTLTNEHARAADKLAQAGARYFREIHGALPGRTASEVLTSLRGAANDIGDQQVRQKRQERTPYLKDLELTATELANLLGCSTRTVQRHAARYGGRKRAGRWVFPYDVLPV